MSQYPSNGKRYHNYRNRCRRSYNNDDYYQEPESHYVSSNYHPSLSHTGKRNNYSDNERKKKASYNPNYNRSLTQSSRRGNRNSTTVSHRNGNAVQSRDSFKSDSFLFCSNYTYKGVCDYHPRCRLRHELRLVAKMAAAHTKGIYSMCSVALVPNEQDRQMINIPSGVSIVELYTSSQDKTIKRWMLYAASSQDPSCNIHEKSKTCQDDDLKIRLASIIQMESVCLSMFFGEGCLICGLNDGTIKIFDRETGYEITLKGHKVEVHCVKLIDRILVSGDWSGLLKLWTPNTVEKNFNETASINVGNPITCFVDVLIPSPNDNASAVQRHLWIGCSTAIKILDLQTLTLVKNISLSPLPCVREGLKKESHSYSRRHLDPVVMGLCVVDDHIVCSLLSGLIKIYSIRDFNQVMTDKSTHVKMKTYEKRHLCSMTVCSSEDGPALVCGRAQGVISVCHLPEIKHEILLKEAHEHDVRSVHNIGGHPSYFCTAGFDGSLCVWHWKKQISLEA